MAHITFNQYIQQFEDSIQAARGNVAAELLSRSHAHVASPRLIIDDPKLAVDRVLDPPWNDVVIYHLKCIAAVSNHDFDEAYKQQSSLVQSFNKIFQSMKDENWALPILYAVCLDLRLLALSADTQLWSKAKCKPGEKLEKAAEVLMGCFRVCANDSRSTQEDSKRWGMMNLINQLFKIYFKINKLHLCKPLIRAIDNTNLKDSFSISQMVTYRYYVGRKAMFEGDFKNAAEYLKFSFERCHKSAKRNKRLILIYLIPIKMLLGQMPSLEVLKKYDLMEFADVKKAVIEGNLLKLNEALTKNEIFFIKSGVFLILQKLKIITYRSLFKKVYLLLKTHQIPMEAFLAALKFMQVEDIDLEETHCLVANLIYEGKIKGYISLQHQKLVVSKQNAFPSLSSSF